MTHAVVSPLKPMGGSLPFGGLSNKGVVSDHPIWAPAL